jgi:hypothetical protein
MPSGLSGVVVHPNRRGQSHHHHLRGNDLCVFRASSDEEEDYLSEKFLAGITASGPKTYSQRRQEAQRQAEIRNLAGRSKSKKEIERENLEALKEGMGTSLFEREKLGEVGGPSKAMNIMAKMGFKPGQTLGQQREPASSTESGGVLSKKGDQTISGLKVSDHGRLVGG